MKNVPFQNMELHDAKKTIYFTVPKKTFIKYLKKIVFLLCCEPVLFHAFDAQSRLQFAWAK